MRYILTLLKDLPDYPAGTQFKYSYGYDRGTINRGHLMDPQPYMGLINDDNLYNVMLIPKKIIDNPEWVKKEIDYSKSMDLRCPVCGETRGNIIVCGRTCGSKSDGYYNDANVYFEYDCGHELRQLYSCR